MDPQTALPTEFEMLKKDRNYPAALELILKQVEEGRPVSQQYLIEAAFLYKSMRRFSEAADWFKRAIDAGEDTRALHLEQAVCLMDSARYKEAEVVAGNFLRRQPKDLVFMHLLGIVLKKQRRYAEAVKLILQVCRASPKNPEPHRNLGNAYDEMGDIKSAEAMYRKTAMLEPKNPENWRLVGYTLAKQEKYAEAVQNYRKSLAVNPHHASVFIDMIGTLCNARQFEEGQKEIDTRLTAFPRDAQAYSAQAWLLKFQGKMLEAIEAMGTALELQPSNVPNLLAMARFLEYVDRSKANDYFRKAVSASNRSLRALSKLCQSLNRSRYGSEAAHIQEAYEVACEIVTRFPRDSLVSEADAPWDLFLRCVDYDRFAALPERSVLMRHWIDEGRIEPFWTVLGRAKTFEDRLEIVKYHREWGQKIEAAAAKNPVRHSRTPIKSKIRVGIMSSDLRNHPVTYFALPLLENYDRERFEVYCYSFYTGVEDPLQKHITANVSAFRWWPHQHTVDVAQGIADDHLDILFELGGPTDMNKVSVMAYKAAPVQASWLGYPHSIGISAIDYILVDPYLKPEDPRLLVEKPFEVLETWVSLGRTRFHDSIAITPEIPQNRNGGMITFGTMNNPNKYTPELIATWAEVLNQVRNSRFLFVRPEGDVPAFKMNMAKEFGKHGIDENRLAYIAIRGNNMPHYNEIDIALDTFPHVGGTTTCETLWMGVPVVTLVGPAFFERISYSNLNNSGLGDLCAFTREEYVAKAIALAGDKKRREALRTGLRVQIRNLPLGQTERFAQNFYKKIEEVLK